VKRSGRKYPKVTYEFAQEEIAAKNGIDVSAIDATAGIITPIKVKFDLKFQEHNFSRRCHASK
jgi:hypothetical protein